MMTVAPRMLKTMSLPTDDYSDARAR